MHALPLDDQVTGVALQQVVIRLSIPMGMGVTTVIWGSCNPAPNEAFSPLDGWFLVSLQKGYFYVFVATLCFSVVALLVSPFACVGKLGVASTASDPSLLRTGSGLRNMNHDGPGDMAGDVSPFRSLYTNKRISQLIKPRSSSLGGASFKNVWRCSSAGANSSFHLPGVPDSRASTEMSGLGFGLGLSSPNEDRKSQRDSMAMAERVIWLVCEDCGSSKRIVEPISDPERYFYDGAVCDGGQSQCNTKPARAPKRSSTPLSPTSEYGELQGGGGPLLTGSRRFALVAR